MSADRGFVPLFEIARQRELGWPDFHPEDYCHRCGYRNVESWGVDDSLWNLVAGVGDILCPQCFTELITERLDGPHHWELQIPIQEQREWPCNDTADQETAP